MSTVRDRLRNSNPVPNPRSVMDEATQLAVRDAIRLATGTREGEGGTRSESYRLRSKRQHNRSPSRLRSWPYLAVAGVVAAAVVVGQLLRTNQPDLVAAQRQPLDVAEGFIEARNSHNSAAALELLAPAAQLDEYPVVRGTYELPAAFEFLRIVDERYETYSCQEMAPASPEVLCEYTLESELTRRAWSDAVHGRLTLVVEQGRIVELRNDIDDMARYSTEVLELWFRSFPEGGYERLGRHVLRDGLLVPTPRLSPEALDELDDHVSRLGGTPDD